MRINYFILCLFPDTCNVDRSVFYSSWMHSPPFTINTNSSKMPGGIIASVLREAVSGCYGFCANLDPILKINYAVDGTGNPAMKQNHDQLLDTLSSKTDFTFPVSKHKFKHEEFQFINLLTIPGVALLEREEELVNVGENVVKATHAVYGEILIFIIFCLLFGVMIWLLVSN